MRIRYAPLKLPPVATRALVRYRTITPMWTAPRDSALCRSRPFPVAVIYWRPLSRVCRSKCIKKCGTAKKWKRYRKRRVLGCVALINRCRTQHYSHGCLTTFFLRNEVFYTSPKEQATGSRHRLPGYRPQWFHVGPSRPRVLRTVQTSFV